MALSVYMPLAYFVDAVGSFVVLEALGFISRDGYTYTWGIFTFGVVSALIAFFSIFMFKNRKRQMLLCKINALCIVAFYLTAGVYVYSAQAKYNFVFEAAQFGFAFPVIALILNFLAFFKIKADEKLVKSLDRIR